MKGENIGIEAPSYKRNKDFLCKGVYFRGFKDFSTFISRPKTFLTSTIAVKEHIILLLKFIPFVDDIIVQVK